MRIDGKKIRDRIFGEISESLRGRTAPLSLAIVVVGDNPVIEGFVGLKKRAALALGIGFVEHRFNEDVDEGKILRTLEALAEDPLISGIVVQLPLPAHMNMERVLSAIPIEKDIDVISRAALVSFESGTSKILPPVVGAVKEIFSDAGISVKGKRVLVIGRGRLVGGPVAVWLGGEGANVSIADDTTQNIAEAIKAAEVIVSGAGVPALVRPEMLAPGAVLVDAGSSESLGRIVGDIDPLCEEVASIFTPVPGGVGPITIAILFRNLSALVRTTE